eukprot:TRINITY_DN1171_c2_g4_i1.p1 TRINITY_DN1171_c2_g4~~TRINITY_DN1171_c2_g4_i1.p1  ORF type:complete len:994 (+),score=193.46 TRINITY_DN1171_c2_g4_i1:71-3052(+)
MKKLRAPVSVTDFEGQPYTVHEGYLPDGDDVPIGGRMTVAEALRRASSAPSCIGFTYQGIVEPTTLVRVRFKTRWRLVVADDGGDGWHSYRKDFVAPAGSPVRLVPGAVPGNVVSTEEGWSLTCGDVARLDSVDQASGTVLLRNAAGYQSPSGVPWSVVRPLMPGEPAVSVHDMVAPVDGRVRTWPGGFACSVHRPARVHAVDIEKARMRLVREGALSAWEPIQEYFWVPDPPTIPRTLLVNRAGMRWDGEYVLCNSTRINGMPVWEGRRGTYIFSSLDRFWRVGDQQNFESSEATSQRFQAAERWGEWPVPAAEQLLTQTPEGAKWPHTQQWTQVAHESRILTVDLVDMYEVKLPTVKKKSAKPAGGGTGGGTGGGRGGRKVREPTITLAVGDRVVQLPLKDKHRDPHAGPRSSSISSSSAAPKKPLLAPAAAAAEPDQFPRCGSTPLYGGGMQHGWALRDSEEGVAVLADTSEEVKGELSTLGLIFEESVGLRVRRGPDGVVQIRLPHFDAAEGTTARVSVTLSLPKSYPEVPPELRLHSVTVPRHHLERIAEETMSDAADVGDTGMYALVSGAKEKLLDLSSIECASTWVVCLQCNARLGSSRHPMPAAEGTCLQCRGHNTLPLPSLVMNMDNSDCSWCCCEESPLAVLPCDCKVCHVCLQGWFLTDIRERKLIQTPDGTWTVSCPTHGVPLRDLALLRLADPSTLRRYVRFAFDLGVQGVDAVACPTCSSLPFIPGHTGLLICCPYCSKFFCRVCNVPPLKCECTMMPVRREREPLWTCKTGTPTGFRVSYDVDEGRTALTAAAARKSEHIVMRVTLAAQPGPPTVLSVEAPVTGTVAELVTAVGHSEHVSTYPVDASRIVLFHCGGPLLDPDMQLDQARLGDGSIVDGVVHFPCSVQEERKIHSEEDLHSFRVAQRQGKPCTDAETALKKLGYKKCPKCSVPVERMAGCKFMYCPCGAEFCILCGYVCPPGRTHTMHDGCVERGFAFL